MGYWTLLVIADVIFAVTGAILDATKVTSFPTWLWVTAGALGLAIAPFFVFHKVRVQRDEKRERIRTLINERPALTVTHYTEPDDKEGAEAGYLRVHNR